MNWMKKKILGQLIPYLWLSSWLWSSSSPPPVTFFTITLSELFLLLCGKMAERKCVYTVILLSVCAVWPRPEISFGMLSRIPPPFFFLISNFFLSTHPHPHLFPLPPLLLWHAFITSDRRSRPDRYSDSMVSSDPWLKAASLPPYLPFCLPPSLSLSIITICVNILSVVHWLGLSTIQYAVISIVSLW